MVQDADMEVVRQMVRYMYTAKVINNNNQVTLKKKNRLTMIFPGSKSC